MVTLVKNTLHKTVEKSKLEWKELGEVLTDIETTLNNRLLIQHRRRYPISSFNTIFTGINSKPVIPNKDLTNIENKDLQKRQKVHAKMQGSGMKEMDK